MKAEKWGYAYRYVVYVVNVYYVHYENAFPDLVVPVRTNRMARNHQANEKLGSCFVFKKTKVDEKKLRGKCLEFSGILCKFAGKKNN